jgi:hypothetical protein
MDSRREIEKRLAAFSLLILTFFAALSFAGCALTGAESTVGQQMAVTPSAVSFGGVRVGQSGWKGATVTNQGTSALTISQAALTGSSFFFLSAPSLPLVLAPGKSTTFGIKFAPQSAQPANGSLTISSASGAQIIVPVTGWGAQSLIAVNPMSMNFGSVSVGANSAQTLMITNLGNATLTITSEAISGAGFSLPGPLQPIGISDNQTVPLTVQFAPQAGGNATGILTLVSDAPTSPLTISLSGNGVTAPTPQLTITPNPVNFSSVVTGTTNSQTVKLTNTGNANLTVDTASISGTGFTMSGLNPPLTLSAAQGATFTVQFAPQNTGGASGSLVFRSNDPNSPTTVQLSGTGVAPTLILTPNPSSVNFGNVNLGNSSSQNVTLTNSGNSNINISQVNVTGNGFSATGVAPPVMLTPGQMATLSTKFSPSGAGNASGNVQVVSNASSATNIPLAGNGVQPVSHSATLTWTASRTSTVIGYNTYRGGQSGGPYTKLNASPVAATTNVDATVQAGQTYFWVVTAVDSNGTESVFSNEVTATVPTP